MQLTQFLYRGAHAWPTRPAHVCGSKRRTCAALNERAARLAGVLAEPGVRTDDRVALLGLNRIESVDPSFTARWIGATVCPLHVRWSAAELADALADTGAAVRLVNDVHAAFTEHLRRAEQALACHRTVAQYAVFGVHDAHWGEAVQAVVALRPGAEGGDKALLRRHCRTLLAGYKCLKHITFADRLPLTASGKVNKPTLCHTHIMVISA